MVAVLDPVITLEIIGGLAGLENYQSFHMHATPDDLVCWLEAVDAPEIVIPCADALAAIPEYHIEIDDAAVAALELTSPHEVTVLLVIQNWAEPSEMALSLSGPIVVNRRTGHAIQLVVPGAGRRALS